MHIAEGVLSPAILVSGAVLAASGTYLGLRRLDWEQILPVGVQTAVFFVASLIHLPLGLTNAHLLLNGLLGIFLGWAIFPAILVALLLQAVFFQFGGLTILGVNTCTMGLAGLCAYYVYKAIYHLRPNPTGLKIAAFCGGALGIFLAALFTAFALAFTDEGFLAAAQILFIAHLPIMLAEGIITMLTLNFVAKVKPELLHLS